MASAFINSLPDNIKFWFAQAAVGMIIADGKIYKDERFYLEGILMFLDGDDQLDEIMKIVNNQQVPKLAKVRTNRKIATRILIEIGTITVQDGVISKNEAVFFDYIGRRLGFDSFFAKRVLDWATEYAVVEAKRKALYIQGESTEGREMM